MMANYGNLFELVALGTSRFFRFRPEVEMGLRAAARQSGLIYGRSKAIQQTQAYANYVNLKYAHLKAITPLPKPPPKPST